jgi:branched-chain amino acid transport system substrate-binding protein
MFVAVLVSLLALPAAASAARPIRIAVEAPLTGSQSSNGLDQLRGVRLAVREANAKGGILGRRVKIIRADDKGDQANAKRVARRVVKRKAVAVIGPYNSSVGIINLPIYLKNRVVPVHLTSTDDTKGQGVTIQPKNSQISAPLEETYVTSSGAKRVAMLVDDTANGAFTIGMADRLQQRLTADGVAVTRISVKEVTDNVEATYYSTKVAEALATAPDLLYVSTYYPEGVRIAQALASSSAPPCLMGLANVDPAFVGGAGLAASQRCVFSGVPEAPQLPSAKSFVRRYRKAFKKEPGVWGVFTYDSAKILFRAMRKAHGTGFKKVLRRLQRTKGYRGQTGSITIDPKTGYRIELPFLNILEVDAQQHFVISG